MSLITVPAQIEKVKTEKDRTLTIVASTLRELDPLEMTVLFDLNQRAGHLGFKEAPIKEDELADLPAIEKGPEDTKSPAERLKAVLYVLHKQRGGKEENFRAFYEQQVERFIAAVKEKLS